MASPAGTAPLPPQNLDAEESVLGAMMLSPTAVDTVVDLGLVAADFYRGTHGVIFDAIVALYLADRPVDAITVVDRLDQDGRVVEVGGAEHVHSLAALVPATSNVGHYARIVKEMAALRALIRAGNDIARLGWDRGSDYPDLIEQAEKLVFDIAISGRTSDFVSASDVVTDVYRQLEELHQRGRELVGVPTGFRRLDELTSGFQPGNLIVIAARPSMGKTALALGVAAHVALREGKPVGLFTLEMGRTEVVQRLLSAEGLVDSRKLKNGNLDASEWAAVTETSAKLHGSRLMIDDTGDLTALELRAKARRLRMRHPALALIVVDYLQLMTSGGRAENRVQDVSQTSRALKVLARELDVPIVALSQLSRGVEQRHDKRPILSDLRESGSIEQDADLVAFLYRDEYYNPEETDQEGIAELNVAKHRSGPTGTIKISFVKRYTRFSDLPVGSQ